MRLAVQTCETQYSMAVDGIIFGLGLVSGSASSWVLVLVMLLVLAVVVNLILGDVYMIHQSCKGPRICVRVCIRHSD